MEFPLVSVIVPMYNAQATIRRCVDSIRAQSYKSLEILLLNDGSKDNTLALCRELAATDPRIAVIDKPNSGAADTRNRGLDLAHGKYIQFVDSDDYLLPGFTTRLVDTAEKYEAALVIAPYRMVVPRRDGGLDSREYTLLPAGVYDKEEYLRQVIRQPASFYFGSPCNKLYRTDVIRAGKLRFPQRCFAEDQQFNTDYLDCAHGCFAAMDEAGYCYQQNPESVCHTRVSLRDMLRHRDQMYHTYKALCIRMGIYPEMRRQLHGIYTSLFESPLPSGPVQKLSDALAHTPARKIR